MLIGVDHLDRFDKFFEGYPGYFLNLPAVELDRPPLLGIYLQAGKEMLSFSSSFSARLGN